MNVLTEANLRTAKISRADREYHVPEGTFVTPTAKEYLKDRGVELIIDRAVSLKEASAHGSHAAMTRTPIRKNGSNTFINAVTGEGYQEKPEEMTHLRGNLLVPKTHPRIALRGKLDGLQASVLLIQSRQEAGGPLCRDLSQVLSFIQAVLGAEVKEEALGELPLFGLTHQQIRSMSHDVRGNFGIDHPIPDRNMGETALWLNLLRTQVREAELLAANAFPEGDSLRVIEHLNRLSSGVYILFCRVISGYYERMGGEKNG